MVGGRHEPNRGASLPAPHPRHGFQAGAGPAVARSWP
jgi:hypothetical protein